MISLILWLWASFCPNPHHSIQNHGDCPLIHVSYSSSSDDDGDTGGETGGIPPLPPPPPPPPPPGG